MRRCSGSRGEEEGQRRDSGRESWKLAQATRDQPGVNSRVSTWPWAFPTLFLQGSRALETRQSQDRKPGLFA